MLLPRRGWVLLFAFASVLAVLPLASQLGNEPQINEGLGLGTYTFHDTVYSRNGTSFSGAFMVPGSDADSSFQGNFNGPGGVEVMGNFSAPYQSPNTQQWGTMTGVFGTITNPGDTDLHLIGVESDLGGSAELHETVPGGSGMMMQEREDGFVIPAGGELVLEPGGNHIMLMELGRPITTGQQITLTLEFDGAEQDVTVSARDFQGGEEEYVGGGHGEMSGGTSHDG